MKNKLIVFSVIAMSFIGWAQPAQGQVLLSLLFGDKLNSGKLEFGLSIGPNFSTIRGIEGAKGINNWELGFYFDIHLKEITPWYVGTGVYIKSTVGAQSIPLHYPGNRTISDSVFDVFDSFGATVTKEFQTFYVPINLRYQSKYGVFIEAGVQIGLVFKTNDIYIAQQDGYDLKYEAKENISKNDLYNWFDGGLNGGLGYKFKKGLGMKVGLWYYVGLSNIYKKDIGLDAYNSSLYVLATIPIGKKKAAENKAKKEAGG